MANNNNSNIDNENENITSILTELSSLPAPPFYVQQHTQPPPKDPHSTDPLAPTKILNLLNRMTGTGTTAPGVSDSFDPELAAVDLSVAPANGTALKLNGMTTYAGPNAQLNANKIGIQFSKEVQEKYS